MGASCSSDAGAVRSTDVKITDASIVCEAIFFPDAAMPCRSFLRDQRCTRKRCTFAHEKTSLVKLIRELDGATRTLEVCVFTITCNEIADAIENAAQRGVSVRIITDDDQMKSTGSDVARLAKVQNVAVRHDGDPSSHMHHKFCVIDGVTLINGSFNWTRHAVLSNRENVVITRQAPALVSAFREEFNRLWTAYINQAVR